MNIRTKNCIRVVVLAALMAWPGVETCRLIVAKNQLTASAEQHRTVLLHLAQAKATHVASKPLQP